MSVVSVCGGMDNGIASNAFVRTKCKLSLWGVPLKPPAKHLYRWAVPTYKCALEVKRKSPAKVLCHSYWVMSWRICSAVSYFGL